MYNTKIENDQQQITSIRLETTFSRYENWIIFCFAFIQIITKWLQHNFANISSVVYHDICLTWISLLAMNQFTAGRVKCNMSGAWHFRWLLRTFWEFQPADPMVAQQPTCIGNGILDTFYCVLCSLYYLLTHCIHLLTILGAFAIQVIPVKFILN